MLKKVSIAPKPGSKPAPSAEEWVGGVAAEVAPAPEKPTGEPLKRLTIEIPASLHNLIKSTCAARGSKMIDEITPLLEKHFRK